MDGPEGSKRSSCGLTFPIDVYYIAGISFKTQALYLTVFLTRYIDLLTGPWISAYNTIMKIFFIGSSAYILWLMKFKYR